MENYFPSRLPEIILRKFTPEVNKSVAVHPVWADFKSLFTVAWQQSKLNKQKKKTKPTTYRLFAKKCFHVVCIFKQSECRNYSWYYPFWIPALADDDRTIYDRQSFLNQKHAGMCKHWTNRRKYILALICYITLLLAQYWVTLEDRTPCHSQNLLILFF